MEYRLGELYEVSNGLSKSGDCFGSGYPFLSFSTVFNNYFIPEEITNLVQSTDKEQAAFSIKAGDVFITRTSETADELGMSCVALKDYTKATYNGFCKRLRPITSNTYPLYMGYLFRTPQFRANFTKIASLITRASLRNEDLLKFKVNLPAVEEQMRIASVLYSYDSLIQNNNKRIKLLEQMAENLYKEWFVRFRFPDYENAEFEDGIPVGWKKIGISDVYDIKYGKTLPTSEIGTCGEFAVYGANGVIGYYDKFNCDNYVTLITSRGNGSGDVLRTHHKKSFITNNSFTVIPKEPYNYLKHEFTYWLMKNVNFKSVCSGAAQPQLTNNSINSLSITLPNSELINSYCNIVGNYFALIENLLEENKNLIKQRDLLLPRLMSGKLEV
ncbi:MAG: restriction endonuclease subunit S [Clostridia bacterium]|nr:restriction endonuclease subunit S [Clostridia bacterium]